MVLPRRFLAGQCLGYRFRFDEKKSFCLCHGAPTSVQAGWFKGENTKRRVYCATVQPPLQAAVHDSAPLCTNAYCNSSIILFSANRQQRHGFTRIYIIELCNDFHLVEIDTLWRKEIRRDFENSKMFSQQTGGLYLLTCCF